VPECSVWTPFLSSFTSFWGIPMSITTHQLVRSCITSLGKQHSHWWAMYRVAVDSYCKQYSQKYRIHYFISTFQLSCKPSSEMNKMQQSERKGMQFEAICTVLHHSDHYVLKSSKGIDEPSTHKLLTFLQQAQNSNPIQLWQRKFNSGSCWKQPGPDPKIQLCTPLLLTGDLLIWDYIHSKPH